MDAVVVVYHRLRQAGGLLLDEEDADALDHSDRTAMLYPACKSVMMMMDVGAAETAVAVETAVKAVE